MNFADKTFLITGASKGIGKGLALELGKQKANLGLVARSRKELFEIKEIIESLGANVEMFVGDVADENMANFAANTLVKKFGKIDVLINNAGYGVFGRADTISSDDWSALMDANVKGTFLYSKAVLAAMKANKSGHIINIASDIAKRVFDGGSLYCASKYAQDAFSMALRKEVREFGIKVSVVYSGLVDTEFHAHPQGDAQAKDWLKVEDMVNAILYVAAAPSHVVIDELMIHPISQAY